MKSTIVLPVVFLTVGFVLPSCSRKSAEETPLMQSAHRIVIEAESAQRIDAPMTEFAAESASGGEYLLAPEGPNHQEMSEGGSALCEFTVTDPGVYVLWIRKNWCCSCGNSLTLSVDGGKEFIFGEDGTYGAWDWAIAVGREFGLAAGPHTILIKNREDGAKFDQLLLTTDKKYVPVDIEEP